MLCLVSWRGNRTVRQRMHLFHFHVQAVLVQWMRLAAHLPLRLITQVKHFSWIFLGTGMHVFVCLGVCLHVILSYGSFYRCTSIFCDISCHLCLVYLCSESWMMVHILEICLMARSTTFWHLSGKKFGSWSIVEVTCHDRYALSVIWGLQFQTFWDSHCAGIRLLSAVIDCHHLISSTEDIDWYHVMYDEMTASVVEWLHYNVKLAGSSFYETVRMWRAQDLLQDCSMTCEIWHHLRSVSSQ